MVCSGKAHAGDDDDAEEAESLEVIREKIVRAIQKKA
jgi:hypothetical protein